MGQGGTNGRMNGQTDGRTDSPYVLQDFIPFGAAVQNSMMNHCLCHVSLVVTNKDTSILLHKNANLPQRAKNKETIYIFKHLQRNSNTGVRPYLSVGNRLIEH